MRTFVAIEVPQEFKAGLAAVRDRLRGAGADASWSNPDAVHLTLKFLGEIDGERVPQIMRALESAASGTGRFRLHGEGVGTFPNPAAARVVWLGVAGDVDRLLALQAAVEGALADVGVERDSRPYTPHLTLGRIRRIRTRDAWLAALAEVGGVRLPGFEVAAVSLFSSELKPGGAVHRELGSVALGAAGRG